MKTDEAQWRGNSNRMAATFVADEIELLRSQRNTRRIPKADREAAVNDAIDLVKHWFPDLAAPDQETVLELLRKYRTAWPADDGAPDIF